MDQNILQQQVHDNSYQLRIKMKYLEQDKQKLEISCNELKQSVQLLRFINEQLVKKSQISFNEINLQINQQNKVLQRNYLRILNQNQQLVCDNLMHRQILSQAESEYRQILKGYEQKIIQLRRSIQFKQSCIQGYQMNSKMLNNNFQIGNVPPSNVSMLFFSEIDELKRTIQSLNFQNKQLKNQNSQIKIKNAQIQAKINLFDNYLKGSATYQQLKSNIANGLTKNKRWKSQMKSFYSQDSNLKQSIKKTSFNKVIEKNQANKNTQLETRQTSSFESNSKLYQLKNLLKKKSSEFDILAQKYKSLEIKYKKNEKTRKQLVEGNNFYKQKRWSNQQQLNYYKKCTTQLLTLLQKKNPNRIHSAQKTKIQEFLKGFKKPEQYLKNTDKKGLWLKMQESLKSTNNIVMKCKTKKLKKSLSDILTYNSIKQIQDQKTAKNKLVKLSANKIQKNKFSNQTQNINQFSRFLSFDKQEQFSIIKPNAKITLADRKKMKKEFVSSNLTIIQQNIL